MSARIALKILLLALGVPGLVAAQEVDRNVDPPGRVARVSYLKGDVSFQAAEGQAPETAVINRPATAGDRLLTGRGGRSELTLGIAAIRLDEQTDLSISNLDEDIAQFDINSGTVGVHVRELREHDTFEIDTPNSAIRLLEPGDYRIDVEPSGTVVVSVREGRAEIDSGNDTTEVREGEQAQFVGGGRTAEIHSLGRPDSFDNWSEDRERQLNGEETKRYVSREVVGYEDLDEYGDWRTEPEYGAVWYPSRVAVGWSPYRFGHWAWVSPWGWTWIDNEPWGFAPFHYGRWAYVRSSWCWVPGPRHYRPVYAPALVGWIGEPYSGISVSIGTGPIGWFPLGPREVYVPYRHVSPRYLRNVNVSNTVIVNNTYITNVSRNRVRNIHYANRGVPGAVTTAPRRDFDARRPDFSQRQRDWQTSRGDRNRDQNRDQNRNSNRDDNRGNANRGGVARVAPGGSPNASPSVRNPRFDSSARDNRNESRPEQRNRDTRNNSNSRRDGDRSSFAERSRLTESTRPSISPDRSQGRSQNDTGWQRRDRSQDRQQDGSSDRDGARSDFQKNNHGYRIPDRSSERSLNDNANRNSGWRNSERSTRESRSEANRAMPVTPSERSENRSFSRSAPESRPQPRMEDRRPSSDRPAMQHGGVIQQGRGGEGGDGGGRGRGNRGDRNAR